MRSTARNSPASIETIAEESCVAVGERNHLGCARGSPVGSGATTRSGSAASALSRRAFAAPSETISSPSKATVLSSGSTTMRSRRGASSHSPSTFSNKPPGARGGGANRILAPTAATCAAIASRVKSRLSGCTAAELIAAQ